MASIKNSPGNVNFKCMLFEPHPFAKRALQNDGLVLNAFTLGKQQNVDQNFYFNSYEPYGVSLRPKYVYRDTILKINDENLQAEKLDIKDYQARPLFFSTLGLLNTGDPKENNPWLVHQTFKLTGSLFDNANVTLNQYGTLASALSATKNFTPALWNYKWIDVPYVSNGDPEDKDDDFYSGIEFVATNSKDTTVTNVAVPGLPIGIPQVNPAFQIKATTSLDATYSLRRRTIRLMPIVINTADASRQNTGMQVNSNTTIPIPSIKPLHWLAEKETPLFREEDFFITFEKQAKIPNIHSVKTQMISPDYKFLDVNLINKTTKINLEQAYASMSNYENPDTTQGAAQSEIMSAQREAEFRINAGVLNNTDSENLPKQDSETLDLSNQPYYIVELNKGSENHHYFIIIPYNGKPTFIHAGKFPQNQDVKKKTIAVGYPLEKISRKLSVYDAVSGGELINADRFTITVMARLGRLVITFSGYEETPWIIERNDLDVQKCYEDYGKVKLAYQFIPMSIEDKPIRIGAGNLMSGFSFGPLAYPNYAQWIPQETITFKGPFDSDEDFYKNAATLLREHSALENEFKKKNLIFNQRAEVFIEYIDGKLNFSEFVSKEVETGDGVQSKRYLIPDAPYKDTTPAMGYAATAGSAGEGFLIYPILLNSAGEALSYIRIYPFNITQPSSDTVGFIDKDIRNANLSFSMGAGDAVVSESRVENWTFGDWKIRNCITPIANSFRIVVLGHNQPRLGKQIPIDVASHVSTFSSSWSFTDQHKAEHSGSIKFLLNFGKQTSDKDSQMVELLESLVDKTFYLRVYAWWDCGFMNCDDNCGCKRILGENPNNATDAIKAVKGDPTVIFTGLCFGGTITAGQNQRFLECQLLDYWQVLKDQRWFNSPFFDGMRDWDAVATILKMAGFYDGGNNLLDSGNKIGSAIAEKYPPAKMMKVLSSSNSGIFNTLAGSTTGAVYSGQNAVPGEVITEVDYALPSAFNILQNPLLKFEYGSSFDESILKMSGYGGKMVYFDRYGIFRMTTRPDQLRFQCSGNTRNKFKKIVPKCVFFASPYNLPPNSCEKLSRLMLKQYTTKRVVQDVPNNIFVATATPNGEMLTFSQVNTASIRDDQSEGYVGYPRFLIQENGIFGSEEALRGIAKFYTGFFTPPVIITWEAFGVGHITAGDIVAIRGLDQDATFPTTHLKEEDIDFSAGDMSLINPLDALNKIALVYITQIDAEINPENNTWFNRYTGEWIYTGDVSKCVGENK